MEIMSLTGLILMSSIAIIAFLIGSLVGGRREDNKRLETELAASREELKNYRAEVTSHFQQTAHKVNALTENCRNVYEHLARGAQELCDKDGAPQLMDELNRNKLVGNETLAKSALVSEGADSASGPNAEPEKDNNSPDNGTDTQGIKDQNTTTGSDKNSNQDYAVDVDKNNRDESLITAGDSTESGKQRFEQKPTA